MGEMFQFCGKIKKFPNYDKPFEENIPLIDHPTTFIIHDFTYFWLIKRTKKEKNSILI